MIKVEYTAVDFHMINQQLLTYISNQQDAGIDDEIIKDNLLSAGWREDDVDEGFQAVENNLGNQNSSAAHQQIREEVASQKQGNADNEPTSSSEGGDEYREPIEGDDTTGIESVQQDADTADVEIGESTVKSNTEMNPDTSSEDQGQEVNSSVSSTDNNAEKEESETEESSNSPETLGEVGGETTDSSNPLESHEEMKKIGAEAEDADADSGPVAIRTFHSDRDKAGGDSSKEVDSPEHPKERRDKKNKKTNNQVIDDPDLNKAVESVAASEAGKAATERSKLQNPRNQMEAVRDGASPKNPDSEPRSTADGRRRFSPGKQSASPASKRAARKKKSKSGSGSKIVSILIFVVILALIGGGAAYAYMTYFQNSTPEVTAEQMMRSLSDAETFDFRIMVETADDSETISNRLTVEGVMDLSTDTETQSYYTVTQSGTDSSPVQVVMPEVENIASVPVIQRDTIRDILLTPDFFTLGEFQTEEQLGQSSENNGFTTNRFGITIDPAQLVSDYTILHQALFDTALSQDVTSGLQASVSSFEPVQGQAWLDGETNVPYQITIIGRDADGQDMQVNFQFKNHGYAPESTPSYQPRSTEQVLSQLFYPEESTDPVDDDQDDVDTGATSSTEQQDDITSDSDDSATSTDEDSSTQISDADMRRYDQLRINDVQQIRVALRQYVNETGAFPANLNQLTSGETSVLNSIPRDPYTSATYIYATSENADRYHLGSTLQILTRTNTPGDTNFNSGSQGFINGFNGAGISCENSTTLDSPTTCYDVTGSVQ